MRKFQTTAHSAESELTELLGVEGRLYKDGILNDHKIVPIRLETTYDEAMLLLFEKSIVRPGFNIAEQTIDYPCLFFKVDGAVDELVKKAHAWRAENVKTTLLYSNFHMIGRAPQPSALQNLAQQGADVNQIESLSFLSQSKKEQLNDACQNTIAWAKESNIDLSETDIRAICLYDSKMVIDAFHQAKPEASNAKCFINSAQKNEVNNYAAIRLLLMHALGFDVVIISKNNYASIENKINCEFFDLHTQATKTTKKSAGCLSSVIAMLMLAGATIAALLFGI